jgi:hypothetical protein
MNPKQNLLILGSGVLYAAFFQCLSLLPTPFLSIVFFLPLFFYSSAFLGGLVSVICAILPSLMVALLANHPVPQILFSFIFSFLTPLLLGFVIDKRKIEFLKYEEYREWTVHKAILFISLIHIFMLFIVFMIPEFSAFLSDNMAKIQNMLEGQLTIESEKNWMQLVFSVTGAYSMLNIFYAIIAKKIVEKFKNIQFLHPSDKCADLRSDLPFLFFLTAFLGLDIGGADVFYKAIVLSFACISMVPLLFVGILSFKKIGQMLEFKPQTVNFILCLLFFLVQGALIIVLLGLMECSCNISCYLRQKKD